MSIPTHGFALNITLNSYDGRLDFGFIACRRAVPDLGDLADYLVAEFRSLHELALEPKAAAVPAVPAPKPGVTPTRRSNTATKKPAAPAAARAHARRVRQAAA